MTAPGGRLGIAILGSTGSIGTTALRVLARQRDRFRVAALTAFSNAALLEEQAALFTPSFVGLVDEAGRRSGWEGGMDCLVTAASRDDVDIVLNAVVGAAGLDATLAALARGKRVALANKETLVVAGELMTAKARETGAELLPVDSEHNALHQCLRGERREEVRRLVLTASGGPFREAPAEALRSVTRAEALNHPTWRMGDKITIDSATLMNKGLEVIEAHWLFGFPADMIDVVVHPQSIVHSMVELVDGSIISQMGVTDMRHAIQYALTYPNRLASPCGHLDLLSIPKLEFFAPDLERFPCLRLAYEALRAGGTYPAALNAANEEAVAAFLAGELDFLGIPRTVERVLSAHTPVPADSIDNVLAVDDWARREATSCRG